MNTIQSKFTVETKDLNTILSEFKRLQKKFFNNGICKIRVMPGGIEITGQGIFKTIHGETDGLAEIFVPVKLLFVFSSVYTQPNITFIFRPGELECGSSVYSLQDIQVETWYNSPDLFFPINLDDISLLKEGIFKGEEHIIKYNLLKQYNKAKLQMDLAIREAKNALKLYNITTEEIKNLVLKKLKEK